MQAPCHLDPFWTLSSDECAGRGGGLRAAPQGPEGLPWHEQPEHMDSMLMTGGRQVPRQKEMGTQ